MARKKTSDSATPLRVALVALPWPIANRPSIQLGALQAYLKRETDWLGVDTFHPYLEVAAELGFETYHWLALDPWASEALYAALLYPDRLERVRRFVGRAARAAGIKLDFDSTLEKLRRHLESWLGRQRWEDYHLVGFSISFNQLLASLLAARRLKSRRPHLPIVFGGPSCAGDLGRSLLTHFSEIDYVVDGEGELPLLGLCERLAGRRETLPGRVVTREIEAAHLQDSCPDVDLATLPPPDYDDYFRLQSRFPGPPFIPVLPVELSRGCWWRKCTFCNLNIQWRGYRVKQASQVEVEVQELARKYASLDFVFTDNALPPNESMRLFDLLAAHRRDYAFFGEIRAGENGLVLAACKRGGLREVQAGIEGLSSGLLQRMRKGATVMDNVLIMKEAVATGISLDGNLITELPGSTEDEAQETLANLDYVFPFRPLSIAPFFLGYGSPIANRPAEYGIVADVVHANSRVLFPENLLGRLKPLVQGYRGNRRRQRSIWEPVIQKVQAWRKFHDRRRASAHERPLLSFRDGGDFLLIRQECPDGRVLHHRLRGDSRAIYLACTRPCDKIVLAERFSGFAPEKLFAFLTSLVEKRLLFSEDGKYLALAVNV
ncbi:MAG: RiPP maturation radical SAM protein 1 [Desulfobacteraceae bacterium]|nr:MAG: RiPP maturation radical SAM protein 1 [Desulfobacteraceae bacterium]